ncbi:T-cell surface glycoprotein CD3 gamma chain [Nelusetta ayraudi]|uniref:T-cell surface glycoprotein CD3 gamma chain n=1 Tax=Nelusetta ayraudi TaxID=303726 RepID=UPI003F7120C2
MRSLAAPPVSLPLLLLLLGVMTAAAAQQPTISSKTTSDGIVLTCETGTWTEMKNGNKTLKLTYNDGNTGNYTCTSPENKAEIFVKFRTCDNCVELDPQSIAGLVVGSLVATVVIAVGVHLVASPPATASVSTNKKRSDKEPLVRNEASQNDPNYQPLNVKGVQTYDKLKPNSRR